MAFRAPCSSLSLVFKKQYKDRGMAILPAMRRFFRWVDQRHVRTSDLTVQEQRQGSTPGWVCVRKANVPCRRSLGKQWQWRQGRLMGASVQKGA